jgi:hypothetical protein
MRSSRLVVSTAVIGALALGGATRVHAQLHGVNIAKSCLGPLCRGSITDCKINIGHSDGHGDTLRILEAFDRVDPAGANTRVPAAGNLPITAIFGNTNCVVGGSLPCNIGPGGSVRNGLPGTPQAGVVTFRQNTYVILPGDPDPLPNRANVKVQDLCDAPSTSGCSGIGNTVQFTASTDIPNCNDQNACTADRCQNAACFHDPIVCDDGNGCTLDSCLPATGCVTAPVACEVDPACCPPSEVPAVSEWGLVVMTLLAFTAGTIRYGRRNLSRAR